ncbi:thioredoxin-dependent thiol peroxidase [Donghicola sp. C2-DW-16]|uniref:thioredoxin-dependent peroxiredoxin n=1 Tax=Donghicola mangrovi TaxID=2729614 RepID=A0A850Q5Z8_9RHOB|nr:thioredoxin-dependent thiol peroxidase [Donghicola mangrovi]NVO23572.1 thioredoxin-dependent thiol peroxidase [Donghicola mangrovi]NVO26970.1 thioredoxin-dependent thiol peroxidase [Donghicola mangrovi]
MIEVGAKAPEFTLPRDGGGEVSLSGLSGQAVVLYFYPKDDTPGCTKEAIAFTEHADAFGAANAVVLGISKDTVAKHDKFRDKHGLRVALLSDEASDVCERYGVWKEKNMYGRTYMGIERTTVLIDASGTIARIWPKVKVPGHAEEVLEAVKAL